MCRSVPQMPVRWTRMRTSLMPTVGFGTSSSQRPGLALFLTSAFMSLDYLLNRIYVQYSRQANVHDARNISIIVNKAMALKKSTPSKQPNGATSGDAATQFARRLKQLRVERNWSLEALESASGASRSMLSQIERGKANPTLAVTFRIARAFGMSIGELVETPGATSSLVVIRAGDRAYHYRSDRDCQIRTLSPLNLEKDVEFYE